MRRIVSAGNLGPLESEVAQWMYQEGSGQERWGQAHQRLQGTPGVGHQVPAGQTGMGEWGGVTAALDMRSKTPAPARPLSPTYQSVDESHVETWDPTDEELLDVMAHSPTELRWSSHPGRGRPARPTVRTPSPASNDYEGEQYDEELARVMLEAPMEARWATTGGSHRGRPPNPTVDDTEQYMLMAPAPSRTPIHVAGRQATPALSAQSARSGHLREDDELSVLYEQDSDFLGQTFNNPLHGLGRTRTPAPAW